MPNLLASVGSFLTSPRVKSFMWRAVMMGVAALLAFVSAHLADFNVPPDAVAVIGLVLGEITKAINDKYGSSASGI